MTEVTVVGWHIPPCPINCEDCGKPANVVVTRKDENGYDDPRNLCRGCLHSERYTISEDRIDTVFRKLGM